MKKIWKFIAAFLFCGFLLCLGASRPVQAAPYETVTLNSAKPVKSSKVIFTYTGDWNEEHCLYAQKNGKRVLLARGKNLDSRISTNGTTVFYAMGKDVYRILVNGKNRKKVLSMGDWSEYGGYYGGKIYYSVGLEPGDFRSYDIKTKKTKLISRHSCSLPTQYKHCFLLNHLEGDFCPYTTIVYNAKTGKKQVLSNKIYPGQYIVSGDFIYYVEFKTFDYANPYHNFQIAVKRFNINNFKRVAVIKNLKVDVVKKITKNSITYVDLNGKTRIRKW